MEVEKGNLNNIGYIQNVLRSTRWLAYASCPPTGGKARELRQYFWAHGITPGDDATKFTPLGFEWHHEVDPVVPGVLVNVRLTWLSEGPEVVTFVEWPGHMGQVARSLAVSEAIRLSVVRASFAELTLTRGVAVLRNVGLQEWNEACTREMNTLAEALLALTQTFRKHGEDNPATPVAEKEKRE